MPFRSRIARARTPVSGKGSWRGGAAQKARPRGCTSRRGDWNRLQRQPRYPRLIVNEPLGPEALRRRLSTGLPLFDARIVVQRRHVTYRTEPYRRAVDLGNAFRAEE